MNKTDGTPPLPAPHVPEDTAARRCCRRLEVENRLLRDELARHGIPLPSPLVSDSSDPDPAVPSTFSPVANPDAPSPPPQPTPRSSLTRTERVALFRSIFRGRDDVYARRWENPAKGTAGYAPARPAPWQSAAETAAEGGLVDAEGRRHLSLTEAVIERHLLGEDVIGLYPMDRSGRCRLVVADFDGGGWREDARAFARTANDATIPVLLEISRSADGAHAWVFFDASVAARDARRLMFALLERTSAERRLLSLSSYDRLIPNQDELPAGGFGSLVALPLQRHARAHGGSVLVDDELAPYEDPWTALVALQRVPVTTLSARLAEFGAADLAVDPDLGGGDVDPRAPWRAAERAPIPADALPSSLRFSLADGLYIHRDGLPPALIRRLARLAAFPNPLWHENRRQRRSVWNTPMFIDLSRNHPHHVGLPRGCLDEARALVQATYETAGLAPPNIAVEDERHGGSPIGVTFTGRLRDDQRVALDAMLAHDTGVLVAPPGFGKTVSAAALIAERDTSTLVLVHRKDLLRQWRSRLTTFLGLERSDIGVLGGGLKLRRTGRIDIVVAQALLRRDDLDDWLTGYGQWIIDECHHVGAASFESLIGRGSPRHILGLTATPVRRDGLEPIVFFQCGPIRHRAMDAAAKPTDLGVRFIAHDTVPDVPDGAPIQSVLSALAFDEDRTRKLVEATLAAWRAGRRILLLTERKEHVVSLERALTGAGLEPIVLHGGLGRRERARAHDALERLTPTAPRCLLATGRLVGEGFDHPPLDTLVLAMPLAWRGTLEQYVGRLHRPSTGKRDVRVIDVDDSAHPALASMRRKREAGYRALGYRRQREPELF